MFSELVFDSYSYTPQATLQIMANSQLMRLAAQARHFVVCKKPLPLGEPRACEMEGYEACEERL